jgi:hypothetical protein
LRKQAEAEIWRIIKEGGMEVMRRGVEEERWRVK